MGVSCAAQDRVALPRPKPGRRGGDEERGFVDLLAMSDDEKRNLSSFHNRVDAEAARLSRLHGDRLVCRRGCSMCCVDDITVSGVEADLIRSHHAQLLRHGQPGPPGQCAFLDTEGACRIYAQRPYVCRSQGVPFRWIGTDDDGQPAEFRDICPLNAEGDPIEELPESACWTIGWAEAALAQLQADVDGFDPLAIDDDDDEEDEQVYVPARVALRDLFDAGR